MKRQAMKTFALISLLLMIALLSACGGDSNPFVGKWYAINDPNESNGENFEFKSDGTVINDGVEGSYSVDGGDATVEFFGTNAVLHLGEYEGYEVLYYGEDDYPCVARTLEDAEVLYEDMYGEETYDYDGSYADEDLTDEGSGEESGYLTEAEAFEQEGYFIMHGLGQFEPIGGDLYKKYDSLFLDLGAYLGEEGMQTISKSKEKIVYMSSSHSLSSTGAYMPEMKLLKDGYTIPATITEFLATDISDMMVNFEDDDVVSINGDSLEEYVKDHEITNGTSVSIQSIFFDCKKNEKVTIKYRIGTEKDEWEALAMTKYWLFDEPPEYSDESDYVAIKDGDESYEELDLSDREPGYYQINDTVIEVTK